MTVHSTEVAVAHPLETPLLPALGLYSTRPDRDQTGCICGNGYGTKRGAGVPRCYRLLC